MSCSRARGYIFSAKNLIILCRRPWDMSKKVVVFLSIFNILSFTIMAAMFCFFLYIMNMSCSRARGHISSAKNLGFWLRRPWDMSKKSFFSDFQNFKFYDNGGQFFFFSPYIMNISCSRARGQIFSAKNLIFWFRRPWDLSEKGFFFYRFSKF